MNIPKCDKIAQYMSPDRRMHAYPMAAGMEAPLSVTMPSGEVRPLVMVSYMEQSVEDAFPVVVKVSHKNGRTLYFKRDRRGLLVMSENPAEFDEGRTVSDEQVVDQCDLDRDQIRALGIGAWAEANLPVVDMAVAHDDGDVTELLRGAA